MQGHSLLGRQSGLCYPTCAIPPLPSRLFHPASAHTSVLELRAAAFSPKMDASPVLSDENDTEESVPADDSRERRPGCVNCTHEPALPNTVELGGVVQMLSFSRVMQSGVECAHS